jgi:phage terminase small subunit
MAGRPRKPTHLKVLAGDDKKNPQRMNRAEPQPAAGAIVPPWPLTPTAQEVWDRLAPDRIAKGVLTPWDVDAFALFCEAVALARAKVRGTRGRPEPGAASPVSELRAAVSMADQLGGKFGWTPSQRAGLTIGDGDAKRGDDLLTG